VKLLHPLQQKFLSGGMRKNKRLHLIGILVIATIITLMGLLELSAIKEVFFWGQIQRLILAIVAGMLFYLIPFKKLRLLSYVFHVLILILLVIVLFSSHEDVKRWIPFGSFNIQPSEFAKLSLILVISRIYAEKEKIRNSQVLKALLITTSTAILVLVEPDLATSVTYFFIFYAISYGVGAPTEILIPLILIPLSALFSIHPLLIVILFIGTFVYLKLRNFSPFYILINLFLILTVSLSTPVIWKKGLKEYQKQRLTAFLAPEKYKNREAWQIYQAQIALGSGGLTGKGLGKGTQKGLAFLPAAHTDFIFTSFGEEFGFLGTSFLILLYSLLLVFILKLTQRTGRYHKGILLGIWGYFFYHFALNIAANVSLFPVAGIPLPFMTFGGSHIIVECIMLFMLMRILKEEA